MSETTERTGTEQGQRVERETLLEVEQRRAWEAISEAEDLERWLADEVDLEPIEGSPARFTVDGEDRPGRVERVEEGRSLSFTWEREPGRVSLVELRLEPCVSGIRVEVAETDFGTGPMATADSWGTALARLSGLFQLVHA